MSTLVSIAFLNSFFRRFWKRKPIFIYVSFGFIAPDTRPLLNEDVDIDTVGVVFRFTP